MHSQTLKQFSTGSECSFLRLFLIYDLTWNDLEQQLVKCQQERWEDKKQPCTYHLNISADTLLNFSQGAIYKTSRILRSLSIWGARSHRSLGPTTQSGLKRAPLSYRQIYPRKTFQFEWDPRLLEAWRQIKAHRHFDLKSGFFWKLNFLDFKYWWRKYLCIGTWY